MPHPRNPHLPLAPRARLVLAACMEHHRWVIVKWMKKNMQTLEAPFFFSSPIAAPLPASCFSVFRALFCLFSLLLFAIHPRAIPLRRVLAVGINPIESTELLLFLLPFEFSFHCSRPPSLAAHPPPRAFSSFPRPSKWHGPLAVSTLPLESINPRNLHASRGLRDR